MIKDSHKTGERRDGRLEQAARARQQGDTGTARQLYMEVLADLPDSTEALQGMAHIAVSLRQFDVARTLLERAIATEPETASLHANLGFVLRALNLPVDALDSYRRALGIEPESAETLSNCGSLLRSLGQRAEARACLERALRLQPDMAEACNNLGNVYMDINRRDLAAKCFRRVLRMNSALEYVHGKALFASLCCNDWRHYDEDVRTIEQGLASGVPCSAPFETLSISGDPAVQLAAARLFAGNHEAGPVTPPPAVRRGQRIHVAYLSGDLCNHVVGRSIACLLDAHDRGSFEVTGVSFGPDDDSAMRRRLVAAFDRFLDVRNEDDRAVAERLRGLGVDIVVDLGGYTGDSRPGILSHRPAPVQVNYLGYPGTLGSACVDYILADATVIPRDRQQCFTEQVVYLPDCYQANDDRRAVGVATPGRAGAGLPESGFVFCCFNNNYKITPPVFQVWMQLLGQVPGSVLWLLANDDARPNLRREAVARGVEPSRLVFAPRAIHADHLARQRLADLFLDTLPYNAHTTASDALWAGLPVLTCAGQGFASRVGASLLRAAGLPELVTDSLEAYAALALALAREPARLAALRARLEANRATAPLFDTGRLCRHVESAYRGMWQRALDGLPPAGFDVAQGARK